MKIIFAGGGTAGHVNPALATADYVKAHEQSLIWFFGGQGNIEERLVQNAGYEILAVPLRGLSRKLSPKGVVQNVVALKRTASAMSAGRAMLTRLQPDVVVGTGGYASYPLVSVAARMGVPTAMLEVNATPGMATRRLSGKVDCVMTAFEETAALLPQAKRVVYTGSPVREEILEARGRQFDPIFHNDLPTVTCFWGSVGALHMNEKMLDFIAVAAKRRDFNLLYAAGEKHIDMMRTALEKRQLDLSAVDNIDLRAYIDDMARSLALSDLVICRAGGTLMELCAVGRPAIIVPSPWVAENHQEKNARVLEQAGAAVVITEDKASPEEIYTAVLKLLHDPQKLRQMGQNAAQKAQPQALMKIYDTLKGLVPQPPIRR